MLLDTCVVIDHLRGRSEASEFIGRLQARPAVSTVTIAEVFAGLRSQGAEQIARSFFVSCEVLPVDPFVAEAGGNFMRHYQPSHSMDLGDALIAATAEHHGLELATLNVKHFPMFKGLKAAY
ncbi:MAG: type II toxin-antitoxin system VapC family toxin [Hyphomicrobiaceae bacterium]|nr:MAG: type II toxin-antitoxin system VapC family toxin [Hyphomicrobiaceae bacterium]